MFGNTMFVDIYYTCLHDRPFSDDENIAQKSIM